MILRRCSAIRRRLSAFHDGELNIAERAAVQRHLRECAGCAGEARAMREMGEAIRSAAAARVAEPNVNLAGLSANVVTRLGAERSQSFSGRLEVLFDDLHFVWVALGATGAAVACVAIIMGLFQFATRERPDSMAAVIRAMASPGSNENPMRVDGWMALPSTGPDDAMWASVGEAATEEDLVLLMDVLVSKEGQVTDLKFLRASGQAPDPEAAARREAIRALSGAILKARLQPARARTGAPVAVNVVWLHAFLTVRAKLLPELRTPGRALSMLMPAEENILSAA